MGVGGRDAGLGGKDGIKQMASEGPKVNNGLGNGAAPADEGRVHCCVRCL